MFNFFVGVAILLMIILLDPSRRLAQIFSIFLDALVDFIRWLVRLYGQTPRWIQLPCNTLIAGTGVVLRWVASLIPFELIHLPPQEKIEKIVSSDE